MKIELPYDIQPTDTSYEDMRGCRVQLNYGDSVYGTVWLAIPSPIHAKDDQGRELGAGLLIKCDDGSFFWTNADENVHFCTDEDANPPQISGQEGAVPPYHRGALVVNEMGEERPMTDTDLKAFGRAVRDD